MKLVKNSNDPSPMKTPLIIALDVDTLESAFSLANDLAEVAGGFKVGPRLCLRYGTDFIQELARFAPVFMDNKHFDIPSTMEAAVRASFEAGASLVTVHALAGKEALSLMGKIEYELNKIRPFRILAVTILTSWDEKSLFPSLKPQPIGTHVRDLAQLVNDCGVSGLVCSAHELSLLEDIKLYKVTPGIRFATEEVQDQKRVMGPKEALQAGASALVVGRPIVEAQDPRAAALDYSLAVYE